MHNSGLEAVVGAREPFAGLALSPPTQRGLEAAGLTRMTALQAGVIAHGRFGLDALVQAPSRSGKTTAAVVVAAEMLREREGSAPWQLQALLISPSRELTMQTAALMSRVLRGTSHRLQCATAIGGTPYLECARACARADVLCGTPGRLLSLLSRRDLDGLAVRLVVLDEFDLLLDVQAFGSAIADLLALLPPRRQLLALAVLAPAKLARAALALMRPPIALVAGARAHSDEAQGVAVTLVGGEGTFADEEAAATASGTTSSVRHCYVLADGGGDADAFRRGSSGAATARLRRSALLRALESVSFRQAAVFTSWPANVGPLVEALEVRGWPVVRLTAEDEPNERERALAEMRAMRARVLVCSDVVSRGVELGAVDLIVHAELPSGAATYVNRVGRALPLETGCVSLAVLLAAELPALLRLSASAKNVIPSLQPLHGPLGAAEAVVGGGGAGAGVRRQNDHDGVERLESRRQPVVYEDIDEL